MSTPSMERNSINTLLNDQLGAIYVSLVLLSQICRYKYVLHVLDKQFKIFACPSPL